MTLSLCPRRRADASVKRYDKVAAQEQDCTESAAARTHVLLSLCPDNAKKGRRRGAEVASFMAWIWHSTTI